MMTSFGNWAPCVIFSGFPHESLDFERQSKSSKHVLQTADDGCPSCYLPCRLWWCFSSSNPCFLQQASIRDEARRTAKSLGQEPTAS